jgi:hypothetical protein
VYAVQNGLLGSELPHEMSYPTAQTLQYGVTRAQESEPVRPHVPNIYALHCVFSTTPQSYGFPYLAVQERRLRGVLTAPPAHIEYLSRAALKRRHVSFRKTGRCRVRAYARVCSRGRS